MRSRSTFLSAWLVASVISVFVCLGATAANRAETCSSALGREALYEGRELAGELEVLSWNIQKASGNGWASDLASFGAGVDLAFIQEAAVEAQIPQFLPADLYTNFAAGYTTADRSTGVMTLSTGTPSVHCRLTAREPWLRTPKATSITEYPLKGREDRLLAINLHAINFDLGLKRFNAQFDALSDVLTSHKGPVILAGDLNTWSGDRQLLVDAFMREHGLGSVSFEPDLRTRAFGHALDHIYVRGLRADHARVIPVTSSDHNALRVRLGIL
jgi:endonuclease/exonuclease/phosphatase (EEP) superfamily protein YafD